MILYFHVWNSLVSTAQHTLSPPRGEESDTWNSCPWKVQCKIGKLGGTDDTNEFHHHSQCMYLQDSCLHKCHYRKTFPHGNSDSWMFLDHCMSCSLDGISGIHLSWKKVLVDKVSYTFQCFDCEPSPWHRFDNHVHQAQNMFHKMGGKSHRHPSHGLEMILMDTSPCMQILQEFCQLLRMQCSQYHWAQCILHMKNGTLCIFEVFCPVPIHVWGILLYSSDHTRQMEVHTWCSSEDRFLQPKLNYTRHLDGILCTIKL